MTEMWIDLPPVLVSMMISPARTLAVIILLHTPRSNLRRPRGVRGVMFLVGGILLLAGAFKTATAPQSGGRSLASLLDRLENIEPSGAYKIGFG